MTQSPHIIIVDDEAPAREMVGDYLKMHGFGVTLCDGGKSLRSVIETNVPDLVVLDLNMPEEDGLSIIRDLKSRINVPVIMLTATASPIDRVVGLELGADDYSAKPCELRELMARIRSVLRRSTPAKAAAAPGAAAAKTEKEQLVRFGTKWLDLEAQALRDDEGNEHPLTASEFGLLKVFAANPKRVLSRERLLELANARDAEAFDRAVDLRIMRIRRKIEIDPTKPAVIRTIRGGGYLFSPTGENAVTNIVLGSRTKGDTDNWSLSLLNKTDQTVRKFGGKGTPPAHLLWDGKDESGMPLPDGTYRYQLLVHDSEGREILSPAHTVEISTGGPQGTVPVIPVQP